jgi:hypothetical protein
MATLYLVISPNGNIAKATTDLAEAGFYRPQEDAEGTPLFAGYELYAVAATTPWISEREYRKRPVDPVLFDPVTPIVPTPPGQPPTSRGRHAP